MKNLSYILLFTLLFTACSKQPDPRLKSLSYGGYEASGFEELPQWEKEDFIEAIHLYQKTCEQTENSLVFKQSCAALKEVDINSSLAARAFFEKNFTPFRALSKRSLATGYYEPLLEGSLQESEAYPYPLYGVPDDLLKIELVSQYQERLKRPIRGRLVENEVKPYFTREQIDANALQDLEPLCYVKDKIDLFFLQVQGSGCIRLEDGKVLHMGYADQNGHPYVSIGAEMIKQGLLSKEEVSLESIRAYLKAHPQDRDTLLHLNPSYVFFEPREQSATGALGLVLKAERSVAVDRDNIPLGMPIFISTTDPLSGEKFERMMFAHDTGGAIKGEARIDIFYGRGEVARKKAGKMKNALELWMLVPNETLRDERVEYRP